METLWYDQDKHIASLYKSRYTLHRNNPPTSWLLNISSISLILINPYG